MCSGSRRPKQGELDFVDSNRSPLLFASFLLHWFLYVSTFVAFFFVSYIVTVFGLGTELLPRDRTAVHVASDHPFAELQLRHAVDRMTAEGEVTFIW